MRKINLLFYLCLAFMFAGCFKDDCKSMRHIYKPVYKTLTQVRAGIKAEDASSVKTAGKIYLYKKYIFLNEPGSGIHVIDNSNPAKPNNISFINIPGNVDLAVKDDYLYADSYSDLVVFDISNPAKAVAKEFRNNVFPSQNVYYFGGGNTPDEVMVPVSYIIVDTMMDCETYSAYPAYDYAAAPNASMYYSSAPSKTGIGGSTARFTVLNSYLYTVDYNSLYTFNVENAANPHLINNQIVSNIGGMIETIYPFNNNLFIGSTNGMFIYNVAANAAAPSFVGQFGHVASCDPVVADTYNAFVTLRSGTTCQGFNNQLEILDIASDITNPKLLNTYSLTNPRGLAKDGSLLFICDGPAGLKLYNAADVNNLVLKKTVSGIEPNDVIAYNKLALVTASDGLYQYDYTNAADIKLLSKIPVGNK